MGRHTNSTHEAAPEDGRPEVDGHSPITRRQILGVLGVAGAAAACSGGVTVLANRPDGGAPVPDTAAPAAKAATGKPRSIGLQAGAGGVSAPVSDKSVIESAQSKVWNPQKAPAASAFAGLRQPATILTLSPGLHLARRATYGPTQGLVRSINGVGTARWVAQQLQPTRIADPRVDALLKPYELLSMTSGQVRAYFKAKEAAKQDAPYFQAHDELAEAKIIRAAYGNRQLLEVVSEFWSDFLHLPVYMDKTRYGAADFDRTVIRRFAFGRFLDMLWACWTHPAMLKYLDAADSKKDNINQNSGREILELHSVGVNGGYHPRNDVVQAALVMTGLDYDGDTQTFTYDPDNHYVGRVKVMGWTDANTDPKRGLQVFRSLVVYLAQHPATARHIATDLARRFVSDAPPMSLVNRLAAVYRKNGTAIAPVLQELFASPEFRMSVGQKYRRPLESTVASLRTLGVTFDGRAKDALTDQGTLRGVRDLRYQLDRLGHVPHGHSAPDGYADYADAWLSGAGTLGRWNVNTSLAQDWWKGATHATWDRLYGRTPRTYGDAVDLLARRLLFQPLAATQRAALLEFLGKPATAAVGEDFELGGRLTPLVALILDAPHHQLR